LGAHTTLISGPTKLSDPNVDKVVHVSSADEMMFECDKALPVNIAICAAAVADYKVMKQSESKIKKNGSSLDITLEENPDILSRLSKRNDKRPDL
jgi:Phosphopantothenoylcysteine synthetase/decarboxylase